jgi:ATP-dependent exoDNAse (exonuclease V) beta subunit
VKGATDVESEVSLHADSAYVGGKFDLLMKKKGVWTLVDWKTNGEELDDIPTGKVGIDKLTKNLNNNSYNKYALQLNVYEWAAKDSGKIPKNAKVSKELHHFQYMEDGKPVKIRVVKVPDM